MAETPAPLRVLVAAPFPAIVELHQRLTEHEALQVCAATSQAADVADQVIVEHPDVVVISEALGVDLRELWSTLLATSVATRLLLLSEHGGDGGAGPGVPVEVLPAMLTGSALRKAILDPARPPAAAEAAADGEATASAPDRSPGRGWPRWLRSDPVEPAEGERGGTSRDGDGVLESLLPVQAEVPLGEPVTGRGQVVLAYSGKGGVGTSLVACNLAVALAQRGASVAMLDLDLQYGDVGVMLRVESHPTSIEALVRDRRQLGPQLLEEVMATGPEGVRALIAPTSPDLADMVTATGVHAILAELARGHDYVVVDASTHVDDRLRAVLAMADTVLLVSAFSITSVKDTKIALKLLESLGVARDRIAVVLNQTRPKVSFPRGDIEKSLHFSVLAQLPHEPRIDDSIDTGSPMVVSDSRSDFARQMGLLADRVGERGEAPGIAAGTAGQRSFLRR